MLVFIPTNEIDKNYANEGFSFKPLIIEAYQYHLDVSCSAEKTQNLFNKKVKTGTVTINKGKTCYT